jgi:hypothetical protein
MWHARVQDIQALLVWPVLVLAHPDNAQKETSPSRESGEVSEGVGGSTGAEEHKRPLT